MKTNKIILATACAMALSTSAAFAEPIFVDSGDTITIPFIGVTIPVPAISTVTTEDITDNAAGVANNASAITIEIGERVAGDTATLNSANSYSDAADAVQDSAIGANTSGITTNAANITSGDAATLGSANAYTDAREQVLRDEAQVIIDQAVVLATDDQARQDTDIANNAQAIVDGDAATLSAADANAQAGDDQLRAEAQVIIDEAVVDQQRQDDAIADNDAGVDANAADIAVNTTVNERQDISITELDAEVFNRGIADDRQDALINQNTQDILANSNRIYALEDQADDLNGGVAGAFAAASHQFAAYHDGVQASIAGGYYGGENALSIAVGGSIGDHVFVNVNATRDSRGGEGYGAAAGFRFR